MGIGPLVCAAACLWLRLLEPGFDYWTELFPAVLLFAFGLSMIVAPLTSTVLADAGPSDAGIASGVNNAIARIAGLLGIAVVGATAAGGGNSLSESGFRTAMTVTAVLIALGGRHRPRRDPQPREDRREPRRRDRLRPGDEALPGP